MVTFAQAAKQWQSRGRVQGIITIRYHCNNSFAPFAPWRERCNESSPSDTIATAWPPTNDSLLCKTVAGGQAVLNARARF